ncbi:pentapeptide repeat-containing protein [Nostoc sp. CHAB 5844]|nr:pentapeptide repeat-containing protein [Nostoc sp. CHAB 5844]
MAQSNNSYLGKKFTQASLNPNLKGIVCGHKPIFKVIFLLIIIIVAILVGSLIGAVSAYIGRSLGLLLLGDKSVIFIIYTIIVLSIWLIETSRVSLISGLWKATLSTLILLIISLIIFKSIDYIFLIFTIPYLAIAFLSFLATSLSFALIYILWNNRYQYIKVCVALLIILLSVFVAYLVANPSTELLTVSKLLTGLVVSLSIIKASFAVTNFSNKPKANFLFFKSWAIALSTWGSTSFYNLDLSGIDFTDAILANTDFRGKKFYRTCLRCVKGLNRARLNNRYLDLDNPKVQKLLVDGCSNDTDFSYLNLQGAYLKEANLRDFNFTYTNLNGADLSGADLRDAILVHAQCVNVDFTGAKLTGICIQNWSVTEQTCFTNVQCDYIYRKLDNKGKPCDRFPINRNFEPGEFESLYQEVGNVVELVFKEGLNWRAFAFTWQKLQLEDEGLGLQLQGIEKRGDLWVVKVTHNQNVPTYEVEKHLNDSYLQQLLASKEQQINQLLGIAENHAEAIKELSKRSFGNSFTITGSTITNLAGSGQIEYREAAQQVRNIVANSSNPVEVTTTLGNLRTKLQGKNVATTTETQAELIKQVLLSEAEKDSIFKQLLTLQGQQLPDAIPDGTFANSIREALTQLG